MKKSIKYIIIAIIVIAIIVALVILNINRDKQESKEDGTLKMVTSFYPMYIIAENITEGAENILRSAAVHAGKGRRSCPGKNAALPQWKLWRTVDLLKKLHRFGDTGLFRIEGTGKVVDFGNLRQIEIAIPNATLKGKGCVFPLVRGLGGGFPIDGEKDSRRSDEGLRSGNSAGVADSDHGFFHAVGFPTVSQHDQAGIKGHF